MRTLYFVINDTTNEDYIAYRNAQSKLFHQEEQHALLEAFNVFGADYDFSNREQFLKDMQYLLLEIVKDVMRSLDQVYRIPAKENTENLQAAS